MKLAHCLIPILAGFFLGCGSKLDNSGDNGQIPAQVNVALPGQPTLPSNPNNGTGDFKTYPTSTGGAYQFDSVFHTDLRSNETFESYAGFQNQHYALLLRQVSGAVSWEDLYTRTAPSGAWSLKCSWLSDGNFGTSLQVTGTEVMIYGSKGYRRFSLSNCTEGQGLVITSSSYQVYYPREYNFAYLGSAIWRTERQDNGWSRLRHYSLSTFSFDQTIMPGTIGVYTSDFQNGLSVSSNDLWSLSACGNGFCVWRTNVSTGTAIGFGELSVADYPDFAPWNNIRSPTGGAQIVSQGTDDIWIVVHSSKDFRAYRMNISLF